ncbi:hypothetical protein [Aureivirga marina]|uniref:hypothetical protein n=1 Tax=Aureivirga marina TaxID=1182451 RepID=UPI0018C9DD78|nr:hypothetical protein [Aureivirga marina]
MITSNNTQQQILELQAEHELLKKLATAKGFYDEFFRIIKFHRNYIEAFNYLNDKYFDLVGEYKYSSYNSFRTVRDRISKRK